MPRKSDKIKLPSEYDRRRKLSDEDYENIKNLYASGMSQRAIGRLYKVDHTTIAIIVNPKVKERIHNRIKEHWKDYVPNKEERNEIRRNWSDYKYNLYKKGLIKE